ncbi:mechanosensitive ion channel family protein [Hyphococcus sp.]|uniref:mechanosensitive ion channel family protein n=1 Tax=Hyphococcus sp. TaxID=2038636 RepID=UPI003CCBD63B
MAQETQDSAPGEPADTETLPPADFDRVEDFFTSLNDNAVLLAERLQDQLGSVTVFYQLGAILFALGLGWLAARPARTSLARRRDAQSALLLALARQMPFAIAAAILWIAVPLYSAAGQPLSVLRIAASLMTAWVLIRLVATFVKDPFWSRTFATLAWVVAALNILRLLGPTVDFLDRLQLPPGGENAISAFDVLWAIGLAIILLWTASFISRLVQGRLAASEKLTPSVRGLLGQLIQIALFAGAIMFALSAARVNLTGLAVLTGAIGVGIGFGLQSIFQNFIAGIIILLEKTLKVGDFVDLESGITGEVREINVRSTLVTTNDNVDILVPNAEFITNRVTNWTLREVYRRIRVPFGVAYGTDKDLVKKAALEAAESVPYTLKDNAKRKPDVWLTGFGDSSLDFELVVWLTGEAVRRPGAVNAAYCWAIETALAKYEIEIPFPQRDLHIKQPAEIALKSSPQS